MVYNKNSKSEFEQFVRGVVKNTSDFSFADLTFNSLHCGKHLYYTDIYTFNSFFYIFVPMRSAASINTRIYDFIIKSLKVTGVFYDVGAENKIRPLYFLVKDNNLVEDHFEFFIEIENLMRSQFLNISVFYGADDVEDDRIANVLNEQILYNKNKEEYCLLSVNN